MNKRIFAASLLLLSCVDFRPVRSGLDDTSIYLEKEKLTRENPKRPGSKDDGWLTKITVVKASSPNVVGDWAFPGLESSLRYVKLRFQENALQVVDGRQLQNDDAANADDDTATRVDRVMVEFAGRHVDIKLRESLDGERTNWLEENTEEPWQKRQRFKVDFEKTNLTPLANLIWYYGEFLGDCASVMSTNLVPNSFEYDEASEHLSFTLETTYLLRVLTNWGPCYDLVSLASDVGTATIYYKFSFYRPAPSEYVAEEIGEKDPVNKKYGSFQVLNTFRDPDTGLLGGRSLLHRWDPNRAEPVVFYFHEGFPPRFKPMFETIEAETNRVLSEAGAKLRVDFKEHDDGGVVRELGDIRYSFVVWHQDIDTTRGLLGYGPSASDPRTGEILHANLHLYNVGMDYYRFLIQDYLEANGATTSGGTPWEQVSCAAGDTAKPGDANRRLRSTLFSEMRRVMDLPPAAADAQVADDFIPQPQRPRDAFLSDYHRTLNEFRYVNPAWNPYVYRNTERAPLAGLKDRLATEREFQGAMDEIIKNRDPFGATALYSTEGLAKQQKFLEDMRKWRKNHGQLTTEQEILRDLRNIYEFDANDAINAIARGARRCTSAGVYESNAQYSARIVEDVVFHVAIHELGHNLSLRHNFYGSVDAQHMREDENSASVMDYVASFEEAGSRRAWGLYDEAALKWIYGGADVRAQVMREDFLYCTDDHRSNSPLCAAHDLGITPAQIVLNAIERYDWLYSIRNRRAFRKFWDTSGYVGAVYNAVFPIQRLWYLAIFDWGGGGVQDTLKRLDQVDPNRRVLTDQEYDEISLDFYNDASAAVRLLMAFYDAIINQPASFRNYQTEFDPFYGDILRIGIIIDKLFAMFAFMDLQDVYNHNPNVQTYVAMYDAPFGGRNLPLSQRVLDNMLGSNYDTFPWFKYYALFIFGNVTNSNLVNSTQLKERIAIRRFERLEDFVAEFGVEAHLTATSIDNPTGIFVHEGQQYVYTYLADRGWHLVASQSRSPVSYQFIRDYNDDLNAAANETLDNFGLKILLAYYEYFNNFSGF